MGPKRNVVLAEVPTLQQLNDLVLLFVKDKDQRAKIVKLAAEAEPPNVASLNLAKQIVRDMRNPQERDVEFATSLAVRCPCFQITPRNNPQQIRARDKSDPGSLI